MNRKIASFRTGSRHVTDLLPAYINGTLTTADSRQVDQHLVACSHCRQDLSLWEALAQVTRSSQNLSWTASPPSDVLSGVFAELDAAEAPALAGRWVPGAVNLVRYQLRLVPRGIWAASTLATLLCLAPLIWPQIFFLHDVSRHVAIIQSVVTPVVMALGLAFIYGPEHDPGLEIALSTPISPRWVLLCRLLPVVGYNLLLSLGVTLIAVALHGGDFALLISFWAGPVLLLSSLSLALSIGVGTVIGAGVASCLWLLHLIATLSSSTAPAQSEGALPFGLWQTSPAMLVLAFLLFLGALAYVPWRVPHVDA
jgi:hypothetical protein